jgi:hypothetical protein
MDGQPYGRSSIEIDRDSHTVSVAGVEVHTTPSEYEIVAFLLARRGRLVGRQTLADVLYGAKPDCDAPRSNVVDVMICRIRRKLTAAGSAVTVQRRWGTGYFLPVLLLLLLPAGCGTQAQQSAALATPAGQLFCRVQLSGAASIVVAVVNAAAAGASGPAAPAVGPLSVIATGAAKADVDAACAAAAVVIAGQGAVGVPTPPPPAGAVVPSVPIVAAKPV